MSLPDASKTRSPDHPIESFILSRWSPRAMTGEGVSTNDLNRLFEAARWAPSTYNEQEWRFLYAHRDTPQWSLFFDLLVEFNQSWCENAGVLLVALSHKVFARNGKPNPVHAFDTGAAWMNLALQGTAMGLVTHGMIGFDFDKARTVLEVPDEYEVNAMIAIGHPGALDSLPAELQEREAPSDRMPITDFIRAGKFAF